MYKCHYRTVYIFIAFVPYTLLIPSQFYIVSQLFCASYPNLVTFLEHPSSTFVVCDNGPIQHIIITI